MTVPSKDIKSIVETLNKVYIVYNDGSKRWIKGEDIVFDENYKNDSDIPLNDHCL